MEGFSLSICLRRICGLMMMASAVGAISQPARALSGPSCSIIHGAVAVATPVANSTAKPEKSSEENLGTNLKPEEATATADTAGTSKVLRLGYYAIADESGNAHAIVFRELSDGIREEAFYYPKAKELDWTVVGPSIHHRRAQDQIKEGTAPPVVREGIFSKAPKGISVPMKFRFRDLEDGSRVIQPVGSNKAPWIPVGDSLANRIPGEEITSGAPLKVTRSGRFVAIQSYDLLRTDRKEFIEYSDGSRYERNQGEPDTAWTFVGRAIGYRQAGEVLDQGMMDAPVVREGKFRRNPTIGFQNRSWVHFRERADGSREEAGSDGEWVPVGPSILARQEGEIIEKGEAATVVRRGVYHSSEVEQDVEYMIDSEGSRAHRIVGSSEWNFG